MILRDVAKTLVKELDTAPEDKRRDKYSWDAVILRRQDEACNEVKEALERESIAEITKSKIERRLRKMILDVQRSECFTFVVFVLRH